MRADFVIRVQVGEFEKRSWHPSMNVNVLDSSFTSSASEKYKYSFPLTHDAPSPITVPPSPVDLHRLRLTRQRGMTVFIMVGLPARGKSFISKKLERFLSWRGETVRIFNVGERRRKLASAQDASFFSKENLAVREDIAQGVLYEMVEWLRSSAPPSSNGLADPSRRFAIFDATNSVIAQLIF
jgi:hypothetical protein